MPYTLEVFRRNKALLVFLLDQSLSMEETLGVGNGKKKDELVLAINNWLQNMIIRATGDDGVKDEMDVAILAYRTDQQANPIIESPLVGVLAGKRLVPINEIAENPLRIDRRMQEYVDEDTGELIEYPVDIQIWIDEPRAEGQCPMCHVLRETYELVSRWVYEHPQSFPPVVVNVTDGETDDGNPIPYADALRALGTEDGNVLLFNSILSTNGEDPFLLPHSDELLPDEKSRLAFRMSSELPDVLFQRAVAGGFDFLKPGARGMAVNADMISIIRFIY